MLCRQGHTAFGSNRARSYHMQKNGAAPALYSWALVVVSGDQQIISLVAAPQCFMTGLKWKTHWLIVTTMANCIAPTIGFFECANGKPSSRPLQAIGPKVNDF